jgi:hypothetical protein
MNNSIDSQRDNQRCHQSSKAWQHPLCFTLHLCNVKMAQLRQVKVVVMLRVNWLTGALLHILSSNLTLTNRCIVMKLKL